MARLILNRIAISIPVLLIMTVLTFFLVSLIPGDVGTVLLGQDATPETVAALNKELGLDQPFYVQYAHWVVGVLHGDLGTSIYTGQSVAETIQQRFLPTFAIAAIATVVASIVGVSLGMWASVRKGASARVSDTVSMMGIALPNFWFALILIVIFAGRLHFFPAIGYVDPSKNFGGWISHLVLPVAALSLAGVAIVAKQTHDSMSHALSREFMRFMQSNGIPRRRLIFQHGLHFAAVPIVSAITACFVNLFGGTVALEVVFAIPGLGQLVATSTAQHDLVVIQGAVLCYTVVILVILIVSDVLYGILDPKVRAAR
ncbi:ABC transporter permease [Subtercola lobariae]|uniref:ABC transporter permease n=1 Tax=Subtercola lobariae TaxID=1588641 RepID=A0A917B233_9MICO|nr:ABC transporter permease [Subtercola lobariae]GGF18435.1 ABC transporter permease [Subtercola lobariae]